jgi:ABC-type iron transport system FetAB ATPase subunit
MTNNLASINGQTSDGEVTSHGFDFAWTAASKSIIQQLSEVNSSTAEDIMVFPMPASTDEWDPDPIIELIETIEDLNDEELIQAVAESRRQIREGDVLTYEELLEELGFTEEELSDES